MWGVHIWPHSMLHQLQLPQQLSEPSNLRLPPTPIRIYVNTLSKTTPHIIYTPIWNANPLRQPQTNRLDIMRSCWPLSSRSYAVCQLLPLASDHVRLYSRSRDAFFILFYSLRIVSPLRQLFDLHTSARIRDLHWLHSILETLGLRSCLCRHEGQTIGQPHSLNMFNLMKTNMLSRSYTTKIII